MHGLNRSVYWTRLRKTADQGSSIIQLEEAVDWRSGEEIVVGPTSFEPYDAEIFSICKLATHSLTQFKRRTLNFERCA